MPSSCNVCSSRFSPIPHAHVSGNMWAAKCEYIQTLMNPVEMLAMETKDDNACRGTGRYTSEHWVHSHSSVRPCDLYDNPEFTWNYDGIPEKPFEINLQQAPRFPLDTYKKQVCGDRGHKIEHYYEDYKRLYNITDYGESWWGWKFYNVSYPSPVEKEGIQE